MLCSCCSQFSIRCAAYRDRSTNKHSPCIAELRRAVHKLIALHLRSKIGTIFLLPGFLRCRETFSAYYAFAGTGVAPGCSVWSKVLQMECDTEIGANPNLIRHQRARTEITDHRTATENQPRLQIVPTYLQKQALLGSLSLSFYPSLHVACPEHRLRSRQA